MSEAVVRKFNDVARNIGTNPPVSVELSTPANLWDETVPEPTDAAQGQVTRSLLLMAPNDGAHTGAQEGAGEHVAPWCEAGDYFYGLGLATGDVYRRLTSASAGTTWTMVYDSSDGGLTFLHLWGVSNGNVIGYESAAQEVYISGDDGASWTLIIGAWNSGEALTFKVAVSKLWERSFADAGDGRLVIAEYATQTLHAGAYIWYSSDYGVTWSMIWDQTAEAMEYHHHHGVTWMATQEWFLVAFGDDLKGLLKVDCSAGGTPGVTAFLSDTVGVRPLTVTPIEGDSTRIIINCDDVRQMVTMALDDLTSLEPGFQGWNRAGMHGTYGGGPRPYTWDTFYHGGLYYASNWLDSSLAGVRPECPFICALRPEGPWGLVDFYENTTAVIRMVGVTGDGKMMLLRRDQSPMSYREAFYMSPVQAREVDTLLLEPARTDIYPADAATWVNYANKHELNNYQPTPANVSIAATGAPGDGPLSTISNPGPSYMNMRVVVPTVLVPAGDVVQICTWLWADDDCTVSHYPYREAEKQSYYQVTQFVPKNTWTLLRSPAIRSMDTGLPNDRKLGCLYLITAAEATNITTVKMGRVWCEKAPATGELVSDGTRTTCELTEKYDVGDYWSHLFHFAPNQSSSMLTPDGYNCGLDADQKLYIRSYEIGAAYARLSWVWGNQSTLSVNGTATRLTAAAAIFTDDMVGCWVTVIKKVDDPTDSGIHKFQITAVDAAGQYVDVTTAGPQGDCSAVNCPQHSYIVVDRPRFELAIHDDTPHTEMLYSGYRPLIERQLVGFAICLGHNNGGASNARAFISAGGAVEQMTRDGSWGFTQQQYADLASDRLTVRYGDTENQVTEGMPGYLVPGGMFAHLTDTEAATKLADLSVEVAGRPEVYYGAGLS